MKKLNTIFLTLVLLTMSYFGFSQTLVEIPSPVGYNNIGKGYLLGVVEYQNQLYLPYRRNDNAIVLHKFDGTTLTTIASPPSFDGPYQGYYSDLINSSTIAHGNLYMSYSQGLNETFHLFSYDGNNLTQVPTPPQFFYGSGLHPFKRTLGTNFVGWKTNSTDGEYELFKYDGSNLTVHPNPSSHKGIVPGANKILPIVMANNLFMSYYQNNGNHDLFKFDGTTLMEIPSPAGFENPGAGVSGKPYIFGDALYLQYQGNDKSYDLVKYQDNTLTTIPSPANYNGYIQGSGKGYFGEPFGFGSNLYLQYGNDNNTTTLFKYDGTILTEIPSPEGYNQDGYLGMPFIYNNNLYLKYATNPVGGLWRPEVLMKYDGTNFTPIIPPTGTEFDPNYQRYSGEPIIVGENVYLRYSGGNSPSSNYLVKFDGTTLNAIPNPPDYQAGNRGYKDLPFVVGSNLFVRFQHNNGSHVLFKYDGTNLTEVPSPPGYDDNERGYEGQPVFYNNNLYLRYRSNVGNYVMFKYEDSGLNIVEHINKETLFTIYPNPAKDYLTVYYKANQNYDITVYKSLGKLLATYEKAENNFQVPVDHLANGLYFISVTDEIGKTETLKFVKDN